ncbi:helix-turn-helix transcriptional regulator [Pyxidicoccus xibeiensis]|uniref:helix-turn-helix transcriptional regulator n=1 Tax=Pyxidicoccus xibeiensis TaxID=2906759 RepID=UPI0020A8122E|nr:helix-turn-helix domain-containing protein [Pyxidicoccus xibeiensis]MCP3144556.1 helix-turn-helix domain-containing protein [Pyxidicoccus xibeiensis]
MTAPVRRPVTFRVAATDESLRASIGHAAKAARLRLGLSQWEVAETIGINSEVYGRIERGGMAPSIDTLHRLCVALGISADVAFGLESSGARAAAIEPVKQSTLIRRLVRRASVLSARSMRTLTWIAANMAPDARKKRAR